MKSFATLCTVLAVFALIPAAQAVPIAPGEALVTGPAFRQDSIGGTKIAEFETAFTGDGGFGGVLISEVYEDVPSNPLGGLTFIYRVRNDAANPNSIGRASFAGFDVYVTNVQYSADARSGVIAPAYVSRDPNGDVVGFNFYRQPAPASETVADFLLPGRPAALYIHTRAEGFALTGTASFIDGGVASVTTYAPIPEPTSFVLLGLCAAGMVGRRWTARR